MNIGQEIIQELLEQASRNVAIFGGGFKPPTKGHFEVAKQALERHPYLDELIISVGTGIRNGVTQAQSVAIWEIYKNYLPDSNKVTIMASPSSPIRDAKKLAENNPEDNVIWILGTREGNAEDEQDVINRTADIDKYPNLIVDVISTAGEVSGTKARQALNISKEDFFTFLPDEIKDEKEGVYNILTKTQTQERFVPGPILHENFTPQKAPLMGRFVDYACDRLNIDKPKVFVINSPTYSQEHKSFGGYYPSEQEIKIVVHNRNMADILRTLAHELVHHMQNLNGDELNGEDGSDTENEANAMAGVIMREFGRENPEIFESQTTEEIDEYDVENEQDLKEFISFLKEYTKQLSESTLTEAEYRGRKVTLGKIMQGDIKKFKVYVKNNKGKVVKVNFGFGGSSAKGKRMNIKAKNPKRRAAYRARHNCANPGPRWKANYWSCKKW
jgi:hypothetical protein